MTASVAAAVQEQAVEQLFAVGCEIEPEPLPVVVVVVSLASVCDELVAVVATDAVAESDVEQVRYWMSRVEKRRPTSSSEPPVDGPNGSTAQLTAVDLRQRLREEGLGGRSLIQAQKVEKE